MPVERKIDVGSVRVPADAPILQLRGVSIGFGTNPNVLEDVNLDVRQGEFVTIIGPSGSGKSTILNVAAGLMSARGGTVAFEGKTIVGVNRSVGYMTQGDTLLPWRTVFDNVAMPLKFRRTPRSEIRGRVDQTLEMLDLSQAAGKFPAQLSGGMKRRALLGRSMIYDPSMLLMDEPFAALDAQLRGQMHEELRRTVAKLHQTVLFITHDIYEAVLLGDRVIVIGGEPASVIANFDMPFGADRDLNVLRFDPEFVRIEREVHDALDAARTASKQSQAS